MKINNEFEVDRPRDAVWALFQDIPAVAQCMPGAELAGESSPGTYAGKLSVKLGPMTASFEGEATVTTDPGAYTGHIDGTGVDRRGGSRGRVAVDYAVVEAGATTKVTVDADISLAGSIAQFGRTGLVNEMSNRLIGEFVDCLEKKLAAETAEEAAEVQAGEVKGLSLFLASLLAPLIRFFRRLFGRPAD